MSHLLSARRATDVCGHQVRSNPLYTSMVLAWSTTEIVRYSFYAFNLLGKNPYALLWLRYTAFYVLYPLGAGSEAFLIYATLPSSSPIPGWQAWLRGMWKPTDYIRGILFLIWWPGILFFSPSQLGYLNTVS